MVRLDEKGNGCREEDKSSQCHHREEGAELSIFENKIEVDRNITHSKRIRYFHQITQKVKYQSLSQKIALMEESHLSQNSAAPLSPAHW